MHKTQSKMVIVMTMAMMTMNVTALLAFCVLGLIVSITARGEHGLPRSSLDRECSLSCYMTTALQRISYGIA